MDQIILSAITEGVLWSTVSIGLYITFKILNIADMTTEGSFPLGAAISVIMILKGASPVVALIVSFFGGILAGGITGFLMTKLKIPSLLSGILTMSALYSINLKVMGKPNINILNGRTIIKDLTPYQVLRPLAVLLIGLTVVYIVLVFLYYFFKTEFGQALIAAGDNPQMALSQGINVENMRIFGVMLANGVIALGGGVIAQKNGFSDVNMGIGVIVVALASIIIGDVLFPYVTFGARLVCIIIGSIIYRLLLAFIIYLDLIPADDFKMFSAVIIALCLALPTIQEKLHINVKGEKNNVK